MKDSAATPHPDPLYALMLRLGEVGELDMFVNLDEQGFEGFTRANWNVFANVSSHGTRPSEIARRLGIRDQSVGALLLKLEDQDYVERVPIPRMSGLGWSCVPSGGAWPTSAPLPSSRT
jgi:hypothetical protein